MHLTCLDQWTTSVNVSCYLLVNLCTDKNNPASVGYMVGTDAKTRTNHGAHVVTHLASLISICWRISCRSWSLWTGKILRSSSSCLLGRFLSFTASSSFFILRGRVPVGVQTHVWVSYCTLLGFGSPLIVITHQFPDLDLTQTWETAVI